MAGTETWAYQSLIRPNWNSPRTDYSNLKFWIEDQELPKNILRKSSPRPMSAWTKERRKSNSVWISFKEPNNSQSVVLKKEKCNLHGMKGKLSHWDLNRAGPQGETSMCSKISQTACKGMLVGKEEKWSHWHTASNQGTWRKGQGRFSGKMCFEGNLGWESAKSSSFGGRWEEPAWGVPLWIWGLGFPTGHFSEAEALSAKSGTI